MWVKSLKSPAYLTTKEFFFKEKMAKKSKQQKKQKGAKGKKARAKAKLERQWGEAISEEQLKLSKIRKGKSRTLKYHPSDDGNHSFDKQEEQVEAEEDDNNDVKKHAKNTDKKEWHGGQRPTSNTPFKSLLTKIKYSVDDFLREHGNREESVAVQQIQNDSDRHNPNLSDPEASKLTASRSNGTSATSETDKTRLVDPSRSPYLCHFEKSAFDSEESAAKFMEEMRNNSQEIDASFLVKSLEMSISGPLRHSMLKNVCAPSVAGTSSLLKEAAVDEVTVSLSPSQLQHEASTLFSSVNNDILSQNWAQFNESSFFDDDANDGNDDRCGSRLFTTFQQLVYPTLANYADVLVTAETSQNRASLHNLLALHILNHSLTSRLHVLEHNKQLRKREASTAEMKEAENTEVSMNDVTVSDDDMFRDQGYTRPKVLILLPTRGTCYTFVHRFLKLLGESSDVSNLERFETEFGNPAEGNINEGMDGRTKSIIASKGPEWNELFGPNVNEDDDFKLGVSISPKQGKGKKKVKAQALDGIYFNLYSEFYQSDIILASPLGLKMVITNKEEDFLSSIEVCIVAYSDVMLMQNWDHIESVLHSINLQPRKIHENTDFSRVRNYYLVGQASYFRQLVFTSSFSDPAILSSFKRFAKSLEGRLRLRRRFSPLDAAISNVMVSVKQVFQRVPCATLSGQSDARLKYFEQKILPQLTRLNQKRTLIFIPSYFDFVSLRNILIQKEVSFCSITEYCKHNEISRNRARFLQGKKKLLLYTGRAHFFMRFNIKGSRHLLFLGLPEHHMFYADLLNKISVEENDFEDVEAPPSCLALFTKYDTFALERIVGTKRCEHMVNNEKSTFLFSS